MTISSLTNRNDYTGNGSLNTYSYTFKIFNEEHLLVTVADLNGDETTLALATDYTVTGVGETAGGTIVLVNSGQAWLTGGNLTTGYALTIRRVLPLLQETDIRNQGDFFPEVHENQFDRDVMIAQQLQAQLDSQISLPETETPTDAATTFPSVAARTNRFMRWDGSGDITVSTINFDDLAAGFLFVGNVSGEPQQRAITGDVLISSLGVTSIADLEFSKLEALNSGNILVGNGSNVATQVAMTGDVTINNAGVTAIGTGVIVNADINSTAQIDFSKLALLTSGNILVGNASNIASSVAMSGDVLINNSGVTSINANVIVNGDINASAAIALTKLATLNSLNLPKTDASGFIISSPWSFDANGHITTGQQDQLRFLDGAGSNYVGFFAANSVTSSYTLQLPTSQGAADTYLVNDGTGVLTWTTISGGGGGTVSAANQFEMAYYPATGNTVDGLSTFVTDTDFNLFSTRAFVGGTLSFEIFNSDNTNASSHATLEIFSGGSSGGDPYLRWGIAGGANFSMGIDNSDSDSLVISEAVGLGASNIFRIASGGNITAYGGIFSGVAVIGGTLAFEVRNTDNTNAISHAVLRAVAGGGSGGDAYTRYDVISGQTWVAGIDNSDSDNFKISFSSDLGTNDRIRIQSSDGSTVFTPSSEIARFTTTDLRMAINGTASDPVIRQQARATGVYFPATDSMAFVVDSTPVLDFDSNNLIIFSTVTGGEMMRITGTGTPRLVSMSANVGLSIQNGSLADPGLQFTSRNTGLTSLTQDEIDLSCDSIHVANFTNAGIEFYEILNVINDTTPQLQITNATSPAFNVQISHNGTYRANNGGSGNLELNNNGTLGLRIPNSGVIQAGQDGSSTVAAYGFISATNTGLYYSGGTSNMTVAGNQNMQWTSNLVRCSFKLNPSGAAGADLGDATEYWNEINYKTLTDRGCLGWFDEGVEMYDGKIYDDLTALSMIEKHPTKKTVYGLPMLDYKTFPRVSYKKASVGGYDLIRDSNDNPVGGEDGIEMTSMFSIMIGALKQTKIKFDDHEDRIKKIEKKVGI